MALLVIGFWKTTRQRVAVAISAIFVLCGASCWASDSLSVVGLHVATYHDSGPYEGFNPGLYIAHKNWTAGFYHNSTRKTSFYGGYTWSLLTPNVPVVDSFALTAVLATGYPNKIDQTDISLLLIPSARINVTPLIGLRFTLLPYVYRYNPATSVHFSIERAF